MKRGTPSHPKTTALAQALEVERYAAVGILESLWHFAAQYARRGDIGRHRDGAIAQAIGWSGDAGKLIEALVDTGWLDRCSCHRLAVHDWKDHADQAVHKTNEVKSQGFIACSGASGGRPSVLHPSSGDVTPSVPETVGSVPSPAPATAEATAQGNGNGRLALGSSPLGHVLQPDKYGAPGEAEVLRSEIRALEVEVSMLTATPVDVIRGRESRVRGGPLIENLAGCTSVPWLTTYRNKLLEAKLRAKVDAFDRPGARQPARPDLLAAWLTEQGEALPERIAAHLAERRAELEAVRDPVDRAAARVEMIRAWARAEGAPNGGAGVVECIGPAIREAQRERETA